MDIQSVLKKLRFKEDIPDFILYSPIDIENKFKKAGFSTIIKGKPEFTILFVGNKTDFDLHFKRIINKIEKDSIFWLAYPKRSSKTKTDINRDILWELAKPLGYRPVSMISIDADWSAMRIRPSDKVKNK